MTKDSPEVIKNGVEYSQVHEDEAPILSHTEDEDEDDEDDEDNQDQSIFGGLPPQGHQNVITDTATQERIIIPDEHPEQFPADEDLAAEYEDDTTYIDLIHLKISTLEALNLSRFTKLESLCLRQNLLTSMVGVGDLPGETMEELDLYDNRINHISSNIKHLTKLTNLDLSFNNIKNIKNLETLTELENLYFVQNKIKEIKNLETLTKIKNLELGGNKISIISENLNTLVNLEQLWLGKNRIEKFENMTNLVNLRVLSIQSNRITKIEGLDKLVNLEELYLSHNGIEKIENLDHNTKLTTLDITSNRITKLENLKHLTNLTDFWCSYNRISNFEELGNELGKLPELDTVYFEGNPIQLQNPTAYRRKVKLYLGPSLAKIDATYIRS
ncbi:hypothetical protein DFJ63DRAFT_288667 [Scheffersomyces coipomensis]|uniref:uncharacterized protein n=1 Tax=Scheffersomyces coipomensis TaxID=1788519 RepID=UPI00315C6044